MTSRDGGGGGGVAQIISYLETGTVKNSVNFPEARLDPQAGNHTRLCIITENRPGMLGELTTLLGSAGVNIAQQLNTSRDTIAYNVVDMESFPEGEASQQLLAKLLEVRARTRRAGRASSSPSPVVVVVTLSCSRRRRRRRRPLLP